MDGAHDGGGLVVGEALEGIDQHVRLVRVQATRRLVQEDELRLAHRAHCHREPLALAARDTLQSADRVADDGVGRAGEVKRGDQLLA